MVTALRRRTVTDGGKADLTVGLIRTRGAGDRPAEEGVGLLPHVAEVTATIENIGDAVAGETTTRFWVRGDDMDRELRIVHTPELLPGDEIEVTALWDVRNSQGAYVITVTADAFSQIDEIRKDNNSATAHVAIRGTRVELG
jgi:subtilase family serine protease